MKMNRIVAIMVAALFFIASTPIMSYAVIKDYKEKADKAKLEQKKQQNKGKPVPGFQTATPQQQQEQAKENMKKKLAEEQKKKDEQAKKAVMDMKKDELKSRGVDPNKALKDYKAK